MERKYTLITQIFLISFFIILFSDIIIIYDHMSSVNLYSHFAPTRSLNVKGYNVQVKIYQCHLSFLEIRF